MKKVIVLTIALVLMSTSAFAVISGSMHDFVNGPGVTFGTDICAPCHTPHNAVGSQARRILGIVFVDGHVAGRRIED